MRPNDYGRDRNRRRHGDAKEKNEKEKRERCHEKKMGPCTNVIVDAFQCAIMEQEE